jgi:hypothetical protein
MEKLVGHIEKSKTQTERFNKLKRSA